MLLFIIYAIISGLGIPPPIPLPDDLASEGVAKKKDGLGLLPSIAKKEETSKPAAAAAAAASPEKGGDDLDEDDLDDEEITAAPFLPELKESRCESYTSSRSSSMDDETDSWLHRSNEMMQSLTLSG